MTFFTYANIPSIIVLLLVAYVSHYYYKYFTRVSPLPGPLPLPLVGNAFTCVRDIAIWPSELQSKYGDIFEVYMGTGRQVWLCNEGLAHKVFSPAIRNNFHDRVGKDCDLNEIGVVNAALVFNLDYENWTYIRKFYSKAIFSPAFMKQVLISTRTAFQKMENYWMRLGENAVLDFSSWTMPYLTDIIFLLTTSKSLDALTNHYIKTSRDNEVRVSDDTLRKNNEYVLECIDEYIHAILWFFMVPKFVRDFPGVSLYTKRLKKRVEWLRNNLLDVVKTRREEIEKTPEDEKLVPDLLTTFLTVNTSRDITKGIADDINNRPMSDKEVVDTFMEITVAAPSLSSDLICHLIYLISKHPKVKQRLVKEFDDAFGKDPNSQVSYEGINKLSYFDAVFDEVSRIASSAPFVVKKNRKPDQIGGYTFPENTDFCVNFCAIHKDRSKWTDPELFNPDRFLDESHPDYKNKVYTFGSGLRKCPGRNLAKLVLKATIIMIYKKYEVELVDNEAPLKFSKSIIRQCAGFKIRIRKRDN